MLAVCRFRNGVLSAVAQWLRQGRPSFLKKRSKKLFLVKRALGNNVIRYGVTSYTVPHVDWF
jgi:hypothetical protein